ncbi:hypothetical protein M413DRAFT_32476 [Hebeloma cylindrosporum]|uniref:Uncharacterized protein n=1 Tax=Hebeloma cylindrosporum TaxID=76867 RepID=A0A0C2Y2X6_HEBCY|nr:hypothetical protein M413DRAFT_32476 [Hebeloma cylindrosporum h7]
MNFPRALTPSRNDLEYDDFNIQAIDRVPEVWGMGTPFQSDYPFQTALTPEPGPRLLCALPSPPASPFTGQPPQAPSCFPYRACESTQIILPGRNLLHDDHYFAVNKRLKFNLTAAYYDSGLDNIDGKLGPSFSRRRIGTTNQNTEGLGVQSLSPYAHLPEQSGEANVVDSGLLQQNPANDSSSGNRKRKRRDRKCCQNRH